MDRRVLLLGLAATPLAACETFDPAILDGIAGGISGPACLKVTSRWA